MDDYYVLLVDGQENNVKYGTIRFWFLKYFFNVLGWENLVLIHVIKDLDRPIQKVDF